MSMQPDPDEYPVVPQTVVDADGRTVAVQPTLAAPTTPMAAAPVVAAPVATATAPVATAPVATAPVEGVVVQQAGVHQTVATSYGRRYAFDSVVVGLIGLALLIVGLIAVTRAGFDGPMDDPVVEVLGFSHTATLGLIEAGIGLCLLLCAATMTRGGSVFFGLILGVAGVVGAVQTESFDRSLALESGLAWLAVIAAIVVVLSSLLVPRMVTRTDRVVAV